MAAFYLSTKQFHYLSRNNASHTLIDSIQLLMYVFYPWCLCFIPHIQQHDSKLLIERCMFSKLLKKELLFTVKYTRNKVNNVLYINWLVCKI